MLIFLQKHLKKLLFLIFIVGLWFSFASLENILSRKITLNEKKNNRQGKTCDYKCIGINVPGAAD